MDYKRMHTHIRLPFLINVFLLFGCSLIHLARTDSTTAWYHQQLRDTVLPHYRTAYTTLNDQIVQKLLTVSLDLDDTAMESFSKALICAGRTVLRHSSAAARGGEQMRQSLQSRISQVTLSISNQQNKVRESEEAITQGHSNVHTSQQQVTFGETAVREKQHELNVATQGAHDALDAINKARSCRGGHGFFRWWRQRGNKLVNDRARQGVMKSMCSVVNSRGIDNAKERQGLAEQSLRDAQQRLSQYQQNLAHHQSQLGTAQAQLQQAVAELNQLKSQLAEQQAKYSVIATLVEQFIRVEVHLKNIFDSSVVLNDAIRQLINFELVITPLNAIYQELINSQVMSAFGFEISAAVVSQVNGQLKALEEKMPLMPVNSNPSDETSVSCTA